jgi:hypothetical protein
MKEAQDRASEEVEVELWAACFEEDQAMVPDYFKKTEFLKKSVLDYGVFNKPIKLPLIKEILDGVYKSSDADYFIYTNVDIGLYPNFYTEVNRFLDLNQEAVIINRRRLASDFTSVDDLPLIYKEEGRKHPGFDCFVFSRKLYPKFHLSNICIGVPFIGITLSQNIFAYSSTYQIYENVILTFHIGEEIYKQRAPKDYYKYNQKEFWKSMKKLRLDHSSKKLPYSSNNFITRIIKYAIQPSLPIRWVLMLEYEAFRKSIKTSINKLIEPFIMLIVFTAFNG